MISEINKLMTWTSSYTEVVKFYMVVLINLWDLMFSSQQSLFGANHRVVSTPQIRFT